MTEQVDLGALIAEARERVQAHKDFAKRYGTKPSLDALYADHDRLADALEQSLAELRQERERADEAANHAELALAGRRNAVDALSRAEETIEKVRNRYHRYASQEEQTYDEEVDALQDIAAILIEYDKQNGADDA